MKITIRRAALAAPLLLLPLLSLDLAPLQDKTATFERGDAAETAIERAVEVAAKKHRRVLLVWGSELGDGHVELVDALRRGKTEAWPFYYEFQIVAVDAVETALAATLGVALPAARPVLTVLDATGKPLESRAAGEFRDGAGWSTEKLGAFLTGHAVEPLDADLVLKDACKKAAAEKKNLFVHFGAPW
jgi:hypothetical protein